MEKTNLRVERARKRISQTELANEMDVTKQTIHNIETGKREPKLGLAMKIAKFFGLEIEILFDEIIEK